METWKDHDAAKVTGKKLRINFEKSWCSTKKESKKWVMGGSREIYKREEGG